MKKNGNEQGFLFELPLSKEDNLLKRFEEIHDFIYSHEGFSPQQTLEEFVKILFIKIFSELSGNNLFSSRSKNKSEHFRNLFFATKEN